MADLKVDKEITWKEEPYKTDHFRSCNTNRGY
jgi:hypothetical protein